MGLVAPLCAATRTWTGAASNLWSNPGNWSGGAPISGDALLFPSGASHLVNVNDLPAGLSIDSISFTGSNYSISGNSIDLANGLTDNAGLNTLTVPLRLTADQTFKPGATLLAGDVDLQYSLLTIQSSGWVTMSGTISGNLSGAGGIARVDGQRTEPLILTGNNTYTGLTHAFYSSLTINGSQPSSPVLFEYVGYLNGAGTMGALTMVDGRLGPGQTFPGYDTAVLSTGDFSLALGAAQVEIDLNGNAPGSGYDQIRVTGTVDLGNSSTLLVRPGSGLAPVAGQTFVIIDNDGADPVSGTFSGLPEGASFSAGGHVFQISYAGGTGNDVVLTCISPGRTWTGAVSNLWSDPGNWSNGVPHPGDGVVFPAGAAHLATTNDFPAGRLVRAIGFLGVGYVLSGNAIQLSDGITDAFTCCFDTNTVNLDIQLTASQTFLFPYRGVIGGNIDLQGNLLSITHGGVVSIGGNVSGSGGIEVLGLTELMLSGTNTYTGPTTVVGQGELAVNGLQPGSDVTASLASVSGTGQVGALSARYVSPCADFAGSTTGILSTGNLLAIWQYSVQLNGSAPGPGYDQLKVAGSVDITGAILALSTGPSFVPTLGQQ
jgi:autotransporter-associated beta strand protein